MDKLQFVHLHTHSHYSMLDGMGKLPDLIKKAKANNQPALALTDHGVMHGAVEFYEICEKEGIKPIIGCEVYVAPRTLKDKVPRTDAHPYHLILLAKNEEGYKNLIKLTTIAHLEGFYYKPRIDKDVLKKYSKGLIASSACIQGEIARKALESIEKGREAVKEYLTIFPKEDLYLEVQYHKKTDDQKLANDLIYQLAKEFDLKVVATNDIHYVNSDDNIAQDALICLQTSRQMSETNRLTLMDFDLSMLSTEEMAKNFSDHPEAITNTLEIAEKCNLKLDLGGIIIPDFPVPEGYTLDSFFKEKAYLGLNWRYGSEPIKKEDLPKDREPTFEELRIEESVWDRYKYELSVITKMGYQGYFLIVADFIQWSKDQKISVGPGRGSGAGSIIAYAFNITNLNPLAYNLLFERFLNPDRISMPDFDTDFADSRRHEVIEYVSKHYGRDHVGQIITFGTMAARMAVRDVGRVLGMSYGEVDMIAKLIPQGEMLGKSLETVSELKEIYNSNAQVKECIDIATKLEGVVRHASMHAAGVVISKDALTEYCPLQEATKGDISTVTQYSMTPIEHLGLLKFDFLGLSNLTIIQNAVRIIKKTKVPDFDIDKIDFKDKDTYKLLSRAETTGVFQLESDGMKRYLKELRPSVFEDIIAMVALYRPGPMQWIQEFIDRKHGRKQVTYAHPKAKAALENTYGIIVYQEQVMQMSKDMAGFTGGQADSLRKAIGKKIKELMEKMGKEFIEGCVKNDVDRSIAEDLYVAMQDFAQYAFNKSHAACYAYIAYQTAYLKAHYPSEFMAALMTSNKDDLDKLAIDIAECERMGIKVLPPSVNESFEDFGVVKESNNVRFGLSAIKNVGVAVAEFIVKERKNGSFTDLRNFITRLDGKVINKKSLEALAMAGALDDLGERAEIVYNMENILAYASAYQKNSNSSQTSLFGGADAIEMADIKMERTKPADKKQRLSWERELLGMYVSEHPLSGVGHLIEPHRSHSLLEIKDNLENQYVRVSGIITTIQKILTRKNQKMIFAKIEDLSAKVEILVFPKLLEGNEAMWVNDKIIAVEGFVSFKDGSPKILAEEVFEIGEKTILPEFVPKEQKRRNFGQYGQNGGNKYSSGGTTANSGSRTFSNGVPKIAQNLCVTMPENASREILMEVREILTSHSGESKVTIKIPADDGAYKEIAVKNKVEISPIVLRKLKELVGKDNVICV
ncbi:MAG: DNA polymerase III subunit alpha [Patescibacteria group bacterium]